MSSYRKLYSALGVKFTGESGDQLIGDCPFPKCRKPGHWYLSEPRGTWQCKRCGASGNQYTFMLEKAKHFHQEMTDEILDQVAEWREMPRGMLKGWGLGWDSRRGVLTLPVFGSSGKSATDIRTCKIGDSWRSTAGCQLGLYGLQWLATAEDDAEVWICEGEWDAMALRYLLRVNKVDGANVVMAVPGCSVWKQMWTDALRKRRVILAYDHDLPGEQGDRRAWEALNGQAASIRSIHWPAECAVGWDLHDWIHTGIVGMKNPKKCLRVLRECLQERPVLPVPGLGKQPAAVTTLKEKGEGGKQGLIGWRKLYRQYTDWLFMPDELPLAVVFGVVLATRLRGTPVWMFLQTPPGGSKSEMLMSLRDCPEVFSMSSLSSHALVSGDKKGDPSVLPLLDGKVLAVKDFTVLLQMGTDDRAIVFSQLRDAFDGTFVKQFGNGVVREYKDFHFGMLAGVTPILEVHQATESALGERFLRYRPDDGMTHLNEFDRISRAMTNSSNIRTMQDALKSAAVEFLGSGERPVPAVTARSVDRIGRLAMAASRFRGVTGRNAYRPWIQDGLPFREIGTRLGQQLLQFAKGVGMFYGSTTVDDPRVIRVVREIAQATVPDRYYRIARQLASGPKSVLQICERFPQLTRATVSRALADLAILGVTQSTGRGVKNEGRGVWELCGVAKAFAREESDPKGGEIEKDMA